MDPRHRRFLILGALALPLAMLVVFVIVISTGHKEWVAVDAQVVATEIEPQRDGGPPEWALIARVSYSVNDTVYSQGTHDLFSDEEWDVVSKEQQQWPLGTHLTVFHHPENPASSSLARDGGRQAMAVVAALMTPMVLVVFTLLIFFLRKRSGKNL